MAERDTGDREMRDQVDGAARQEGGGRRPTDESSRGAQAQGDGNDVGSKGGSDAAAGEIGRVGAPERGGEGGYGNDTGFAGGTTGAQEGAAAGRGESSQSPLGRSNEGR